MRQLGAAFAPVAAGFFALRHNYICADIERLAGMQHRLDLADDRRSRFSDYARRIMRGEGCRRAE
ncbi:hypothetical protein [Mesorhizobium amorphae]|uniref:hypothetical protein n=1 Tax=Mesorhizobium amorphae TaxID=71433 RepID=UPI0017876F9C